MQRNPFWNEYKLNISLVSALTTSDFPARVADDAPRPEVALDQVNTVLFSWGCNQGNREHQKNSPNEWRVSQHLTKAAEILGED